MPDFDMAKAIWRGLFRDASGDRPEALAAIYDAASAKLYGLALWLTQSAEDASDVVSEVFVTIAEQHTKLREIRDPRSWLLTVTRRKAVDLHRQRVRHREDPIEAAELLAASDTSPERRIDASRISALLTRVPDRQREAVFLRHFADLSFSEIGRVTGVSVFTAASRYRLAIRRLRILLEEQ